MEVVFIYNSDLICLFLVMSGLFGLVRGASRVVLGTRTVAMTVGCIGREGLRSFSHVGGINKYLLLSHLNGESQWCLLHNLAFPAFVFTTSGDYNLLVFFEVHFCVGGVC